MQPFNDVRHKSFFRIARHRDLDILRERTATIEAFRNAHHGPSLAVRLRSVAYRPPGPRLAKGRIEAVRYVRSNGLVNLWVHEITRDCLNYRPTSTSPPSSPSAPNSSAS